MKPEFWLGLAGLVLTLLGLLVRFVYLVAVRLTRIEEVRLARIETTLGGLPCRRGGSCPEDAP